MSLRTLQPFTISATASGMSTSPAYSVGDMVGTELTLANAAATSADGGFITGIHMEDDAVAISTLRLKFFNAASTPAADNAANSWSDANAQKEVACVDATAFVASALNGTSTTGNLMLPYTCASTSLFLNTIALATFTAGSTTDLHFIISLLRWE